MGNTMTLGNEITTQKQLFTNGYLISLGVDSFVECDYF